MRAEEVHNIYANGVTNYSITRTYQPMPAFYQLESEEKISKFVSWLGEKDFFYVENIFNNKGVVEQVCHLSTFRNYDNIVIQYNKATPKITLGTIVGTQAAFENIKKVVTTRLDVFCEVDPTLTVTFGQNVGTQKHETEFEDIANSIFHEVAFPWRLFQVITLQATV